MTLRALVPGVRVGCWLCGAVEMPLAAAIFHFESADHRARLIAVNLHASLDPDGFERGFEADKDRP